MNKKQENITKICDPKVSFEFLEISAELAQAKHARIMKMFAEALIRSQKEISEKRIGATK